MRYGYKPWYVAELEFNRRAIDRRYRNQNNKGTTFVGTPCVKSLGFKFE